MFQQIKAPGSKNKKSTAHMDMSKNQPVLSQSHCLTVQQTSGTEEKYLILYQKPLKSFT